MCTYACHDNGMLRLSCLPNELLHEISSYLPITSIVSLRATCSDLRASIELPKGYPNVLDDNRKLQYEIDVLGERAGLFQVTNRLPCTFCELSHPPKCFNDQNSSIGMTNRRCIGSSGKIAGIEIDVTLADVRRFIRQLKLKEQSHHRIQCGSTHRANYMIVPNSGRFWEPSSFSFDCFESNRRARYEALKQDFPRARDYLLAFPNTCIAAREPEFELEIDSSSDPEDGEPGDLFLISTYEIPFTSIANGYLPEAGDPSAADFLDTQLCPHLKLGSSSVSNAVQTVVKTVIPKLEDYRPTSVSTTTHFHPACDLCRVVIAVCAYDESRSDLISGPVILIEVFKNLGNGLDGGAEHWMNQLDDQPTAPVQ